MQVDREVDADQQSCLAVVPGGEEALDPPADDPILLGARALAAVDVLQRAHASPRARARQSVQVVTRRLATVRSPPVVAAVDGV